MEMNIQGQKITSSFIVSPTQKQIEQARNSPNTSPQAFSFVKRRNSQKCIAPNTNHTEVTKLTSEELNSRMNVTGQNFGGFPSVSNFKVGNEPKTSHGQRIAQSRAKQISQLRNSMSHHISKNRNNNPFSKTQDNFGAVLKGIKAGDSASGLQFKVNAPSSGQQVASMDTQSKIASLDGLIQVKDEGIMTSDRFQIQSQHQSPRIKEISSALEKHAISAFMEHSRFEGNRLSKQQVDLFKRKLKLRDASTNLTSPKTDQLSRSLISPPSRMSSLLSPVLTDVNKIHSPMSNGEQVSSVSCQQSIIKKLKEKQRAKQNSQMSQYEGLEALKTNLKSPKLTDPAAFVIEKELNSKAIIEEGVKRKPNISNGVSYPRCNFARSRPSRDSMLQSFDCDFGISYKEVSEAGKAINMGQEQLLKKKPGKNCDVNVLETWINETLQEAEYFGIPGVLKKMKPGEGPSAGGRQATSMEYGIDRLTLNNTGISNESIDKLYRSFFITTVGLFQQMNSIVQQQADSMKLRRADAIHPSDNKVSSPKNDDSAPSVDNKKKHLTKASLLSSLWRVYTVLLEYTYSHDYKMQIQLMQEENLKKIQAQSLQITEIMASNEDKIGVYREQIKSLTDDLKLTQEQLKYAQNEMRKTESELQKNQRQSEEEVIMRMKFEDKMNQLHSLNRTFQMSANANREMLIKKEAELLALREEHDKVKDKLSTAMLQKEDLSQWKEINIQKIQLIEKELKECRAQLETQKVELDEQTLANAQNEKQIRDQEYSLTEGKDKISNFQESLNTKKIVETNLRRISEKQQDTITRLNKEAADYMNKIEVLEQDLSVEKSKHEKAKSDIALQQSKVSNCDRLIQEKESRVRYLENEVKFFEAQFTFTKSQIQRNHQVQQEQSSNIQDLNDDRLQNLDEIKKLKENIDILDQKIIDLTSIESSLKEQNQKLESDRQHLQEVSQEAKKQATQKRLELEGLKKSSADKIEFLEKKNSVLENKTATLQSSLVLEERKSQNQHETLQQNRQQISQMTNKISLLECDVQTKNEEIEQLQGFNNRLVELNNNYLTSSEKMKKNLATADQTNKYFEEEKKKEIQRIMDQFDKFKAQVDRDQMFVEDIMSQHMRLIEKSIQHQQQKKYLDFKLNEQTKVIFNLRHEKDDLEKDKAAEMAQKIEFTLKYNIANKKAEEAARTVEELTDVHKYQKKKISDQAQEIEDIRELVKTKKQAIQKLEQEIDAIKSIVKYDCSTQMEVNYYPFDYTFEQLCEFEEKKAEKEQQLKNLKREREMMQNEDTRMNFIQSSRQLEEQMGKEQVDEEGTISRVDTKSAKTLLASRESKQSLKTKAEAKEIVVTENLEDKEESSPNVLPSNLQESQMFNQQQSAIGHDTNSGGGSNNQLLASNREMEGEQQDNDKEDECQVKITENDEQFQAKLYKQDLTCINEALHKQIHLIEGKALLLNIQLKQFSFWDRFQDTQKEIQCNLQQEIDEEQAKANSMMMKDRIVSNDSKMSAKKMLTSKTGPTLSVNQGSDFDGEDGDGLDAFNSQAEEYDDFGALKPKIDDLRDAKSSNQEKSFNMSQQVCQNCGQPYHQLSDGIASIQQDKVSKQKSIRKKGPTAGHIKKVVAEKVRKDMRNARSSDGNKIVGSDQDDSQEQTAKRKVKKVKHAIDAINVMKQSHGQQDQNMSFSDSGAGEKPVINVNTNKNDVFEIDTAEISPLNEQSQDEHQASKKVTSGTQAGRFGKPNIRKLIKGSYTRQ